jgi:putative methionine-R-sulfoxide reductase with GAF domain
MRRNRDYQQVARELKDAASPEQRMTDVVNALWRAFCGEGYSWVGFYLDQPGEHDDARLILGPCRDKPACSPIGLHGVCGQALVSQSVRIVHDVRELGEHYIACDPRDRSEIVIPLLKGASSITCWGVLDIDSFEVGAFDEADAEGLNLVLRAAGLQ